MHFTGPFQPWYTTSIFLLLPFETFLIQFRILRGLRRVCCLLDMPRNTSIKVLRPASRTRWRRKWHARYGVRSNRYKSTGVSSETDKRTRWYYGYTACCHTEYVCRWCVTGNDQTPFIALTSAYCREEAYQALTDLEFPASCFYKHVLFGNTLLLCLRTIRTPCYSRSLLTHINALGRDLIVSA